MSVNYMIEKPSFDDQLFVLFCTNRCKDEKALKRAFFALNEIKCSISGGTVFFFISPGFSC